MRSDSVSGEEGPPLGSSGVSIKAPANGADRGPQPKSENQRKSRIGMTAQAAAATITVA